MTAVLAYWPALAQGLLTTIWVALCSIAGAAVGALLLGALRLAKRSWVRAAGAGLVELIRGASALVLLFWVFYALPLLPGMPHLSPVAASILVLALVGAAYGSEIVRGGIESVQREQSEACHALGMTPPQALRFVVLPQALSQIVPAFASLAADMIKWTAIVSFVGVQDVLYAANSVRSATYETVSVFALLAALYWLLCVISGQFFRAVERVLPLNRALGAAGAAPLENRARPIDLQAGPTA
jgi:polar amino acid transport system permease protein